MADNKLTPLGARVVLKRVETESKTKGGLYIPESAKEAPLEATIVAVGNLDCCPDTKKTPDLNVGDKVIVPKWAGTEIKVDGETFVVAKIDELLCKVQQ